MRRLLRPPSRRCRGAVFAAPVLHNGDSNLDEPKVCEGREAEAGTGRPIATATSDQAAVITESSQHALRREWFAPVVQNVQKVLSKL